MYIPRRLFKYVKDSSDLTVEQIHVAWADGRLKLLPHSGTADSSKGPSTLVFEADRVLLDDELLQPKQSQFYAIVNKPTETTSTTRDPDDKGDLRPWLSRMPAGAFPVGRLDRNTTGLLLCTTDGDLANAVLRPQNHAEKMYWLWLDEVFQQDDARLQALTDKTNPNYDAASRAELVYQSEHHTELHLTLDEGKNRQIRRLCRALGLRLVHLHRKRIGPLSDDGLGVGKFRELNPEEVEALWQAVGGREWVRSRQVAALRRRAHDQRCSGSPEERLEEWLRSLPDGGAPSRERRPGGRAERCDER